MFNRVLFLFTDFPRLGFSSDFALLLITFLCRKYNWFITMIYLTGKLKMQNTCRLFKFTSFQKESSVIRLKIKHCSNRTNDKLPSRKWFYECCCQVRDQYLLPPWMSVSVQYGEIKIIKSSKWCGGSWAAGRPSCLLLLKFIRGVCLGAPPPWLLQSANCLFTQMLILKCCMFTSHQTQFYEFYSTIL